MYISDTMAWKDHYIVKPIRQLINRALTDANDKFKEADQMTKYSHSSDDYGGYPGDVRISETDAKRISWVQEDARKKLAAELRKIATMIEESKI